MDSTGVPKSDPTIAVGTCRPSVPCRGGFTPPYVAGPSFPYLKQLY
jgi:hypothetical protein